MCGVYPTMGILLSTKDLEPHPGDMLRDPMLVYRAAHKMAAAYKRKQRGMERPVRPFVQFSQPTPFQGQVRA